MTREQYISKVEASQSAFRRFLVALCCGDSALADDVAQESYIKAYLCCDSLADPEKFNTWIYRIGYNTFLNLRRGERLTVGYDSVGNFASDHSADQAFRYQELYESLNAIPTKERTSVLLYYMQGYSIKEISEIQETTPDAVKQHLSRGRRHLRGLLSE